MKTFYRFYPACTYFLLDKWLSKMSQKGLFLSDYGVIKYEFREGTPREKTYFTYSDDKGNLSYGHRFWVSYYHPAPEKNYGKQISPQKVHDKTIVLVDARKIDNEYYIMRHRRNKLYTIRDMLDFLLIIVAPLFLILLWRLGK